MNRPRSPLQAKVLLGQPQMTRREVEVGDDRPVCRKLREIGSHAAADLEHIMTGVFRELHDVRHPRRVLAVPVSFDFEEPLERVRLSVGARGCEPTGFWFHWFWTWSL